MEIGPNSRKDESYRVILHPLLLSNNIITHANILAYPYLSLLIPATNAKRSFRSLSAKKYINILGWVEIAGRKWSQTAFFWNVWYTVCLCINFKSPRFRFLWAIRILGCQKFELYSLFKEWELIRVSAVYWMQSNNMSYWRGIIPLQQFCLKDITCSHWFHSRPETVRPLFIYKLSF